MLRFTSSFILICTLLVSCSKSVKNTNELTKESFVNIDSSEGQQVQLFDENITKITNVQTVLYLKDSILKAQQERKLSELQKKSLTERYKIGDSTVVVELIDLFKSKNELAIIDALRDLKKTNNARTGYGIKEHPLQQAILSLLSNKNLSFDVIQMAGTLKIKGYRTAFEREILSNKSSFSGRCFYWLCRNSDLSDSVFIHIEKLILTDTLPEKTKAEYCLGLKQSMKSGHDGLKEKIGALAVTLFNKEIVLASEIVESNSRPNSLNCAQNIAHCIINYPNKNCNPILNRFLTLNVLEEESLNSLVQINGTKESVRVKSYIADSSKFDIVLRAARTLHDSLGNASNIPELILSTLGQIKLNSPERIDNVLELLLETREERWLNELDTLIPSEQLKNDLLYAFQLMKNDPSDVATELYALGIAKKSYSTNDIAKARGCEIYFGENAHIYKMLHFSGLYLSLDSIVSFQSITPTLNYIYQNTDSVLSNIISGVKQIGDSSYTFTFIYRNKAYIYNYLTPNILQKDLISVINSILADNGIERSFQIISSDFEATQYLFAKEKAIKAFKETFLLEKSTENLL